MRERGQVVFVEDVPHFSFFFSFLHQRERETEEYVLVRKREKSQLRNDWDSS